ncbi:MAG: hypothetical protein ACYC6M_13250, partial [Terriglobales bacterium]
AMLMQALTIIQEGESAAETRPDSLDRVIQIMVPDPLYRDIQIRDMLRSLEITMPLATIRGWTDQQRWDAEQWARRMRARRADPADVPARPEFLK